MAAKMKRAASSLGKLVFERSSFKNEKEKHRKCIEDHFFNSSVHILLPGCGTLPEDINNNLSGQLSFLATHVPLTTLLDTEFIEGFVKKGDVYMLSHGTCIDTESCVAVLPTGVLHLSLCKDTYQKLGLEGRPSKAGKNTVVQIDLNAKNFYPGMKHYERVKWCFTNTLTLQFDFLLSWKPQDEKVCPSSIQNYFQCNNINCNRIKITRKTRLYKDFTAPIISPDAEINQSEDSCDYLEVFDWLGACASGVDLTDKGPDDFISSYTCPSPNQKLECAISEHYCGMFTPHTVQHTVNRLREFIQAKKIAWCSVTVSGFMDSPVSWKQLDHGFHSNGDNMYTLLMFNNQIFWMYSAIGGLDICP